MTMKFNTRAREEPEINLIAFIDVLLVVLIFVMLTSSFTKNTELKIQLPTAQADTPKSRPKEIGVVVSSDGRYMVNQQWVDGRNVELLAAALSNLVNSEKNNLVVIRADASATHQSVINVMDAARRVGLVQLTFATQASTGTNESDPSLLP